MKRTDYIEKREDVISNIKTLHSYLHGESGEDYKQWAIDELKRGKNMVVEVIDGPLDKGRLHDIPVRSIVRIIVDGYNHTVYWDGRRIHDSWHGKDVVKKYYNSLEGEIEFCDTTPKQSETQGFCSIFAIYECQIPLWHFFC